jgi:adenosylmethionine-8-amino-7-oxononanoate aminotransferase
MEKGFFHGHTYSANPTSCTAALASIELLKSKEIQENIKMICSAHQKFNQKIKNHPKVKSTRQQGIIFAIDFDVITDRYGDLRYKLFDFYMSKGVYLRPLGNTVYILAPFIISKKQLDKIYLVIEESLNLF